MPNFCSFLHYDHRRLYVMCPRFSSISIIVLTNIDSVAFSVGVLVTDGRLSISVFLSVYLFFLVVRERKILLKLRLEMWFPCIRTYRHHSKDLPMCLYITQLNQLLAVSTNITNEQQNKEEDSTQVRR